MIRILEVLGLIIALVCFGIGLKEIVMSIINGWKKR